MGLARVNGHLFTDDRARVAEVAYDYTVMAGTQGRQGHEKKDRNFKLAEQWRLPLVLFAEGASLLEPDNVIDPAATRDWILNGLRAMPAPPPRSGKKRPFGGAWKPSSSSTLEQQHA